MQTWLTHSTNQLLVIFACLNFREFLILWLFTKFIIPEFSFFCSSVIIIIIFVRFLNSRICLPHESRENQDLANITRSTVLSDEPQTISQLTAEKSFDFWIETNTVTQVLFCRAIVFLEYTWMMENERLNGWKTRTMTRIKVNVVCSVAKESIHLSCMDSTKGLI